MHSIRIDHDVPMQARDGTTLRADVYRPDDGARHPAILCRTPYDKTRSGTSDFLSAVGAARAGYAFVVQDVRGRFASEGEYVPMRPEEDDGYDAVEWVAAEPWCDGRVGMAGGSYLGRVQWHAAVARPPSLRAIAPAIISAGPVSEFVSRGVQDFDQNVSWFTFMAIDMAARLERQGRDVAELRRMLGRALTHIDEVLEHLPFNDVPHFDFDGIREAFRARGSGALPDEVRSASDLSWDYSRVLVPGFHAGGWYDIYAGSTLANFNGMRARGGTAAARAGQHALMGPWVHGPLTGYAGSLHFGPTAGGVGAMAEPRLLAFFDRYLREADVEVPAVAYFVMGADEWRSADAWPLPETEWRNLYLHSSGRAQTAAGDGKLDWDPPGVEPPDRFVYDPLSPVPTTGGRNLPSGRLTPGPVDQSPIERRVDVLCYTTPELADDLEVTGPLTLSLHAATSAVDTDFTAKLIDVHPGGAAFNVAEGVVRARFRDGLFSPRAVTPGEPIGLEIDLANTSIVFRRGHRIRLDITSSNFPRWDRNMNTGKPFGTDREGIVALQTVFHDDGRASHLRLPVIPRRP